MKLIVGLGNPGEKYKNTRHNVGQAIVSYFQEINELPKFQLKKKLESLISERVINNEKIILALPQTFMNESGRAIKKIIENCQPEADPPWAEKLKIGNLIVVHDDLDLPLGKIRIKTNGSSGGHNGVQSIIDHLKTQDFVRIKIGVANEKRNVAPAEKFVLENFSADEKEIAEKIKEKSIKILTDLLDKKEIKEETFSV